MVLISDGVTPRAWGQISAKDQRRRRLRAANDSWIVACCLARQFPLATFNVKDFEWPCGPSYATGSADTRPDTPLMRDVAATRMTGIAGDQVRTAVFILDRWMGSCAQLPR
jgi:hypothetical protein